MDWILYAVLIVIALLVLTPQGRMAISRFLNLFGSQASIAVSNAETAGTMREELKRRVEAETREALGAAQNAYVRAQKILEERKEVQRQLGQWESNRDEALRQAKALMSDDIDDTEQQQQIGQVKGIGQTAVEKIQGLQGALEANAENYQWADEVLTQSEELFKTLPEKAADKMRDGDVAAATMEMAAAQAMIAEGESSFSDSKASQVLERMKEKALTSRAEAQAAKARAAIAPASADVAARMLSQSDAKTADFDALLSE
jgi:phage shock protein A